MDINFEYYKVFYYVAKYGNITKAATAMRSSQPNVTRIMKLLEAELGCRLLVREARGISLTEEGKRLYSHVEIAFRQIQSAQEEIFARADQGVGTVEIGATETALHLFLLEALREFKQIYPGVRIRIHNHTTPEILKSLAYGKLDLAVITSPFEVPDQMVCRELVTFREILVGSSQYEKLSYRRQSLESLKNYPWVGLGRETATYGLYREFFLMNHVDIEQDTEVATSDLLLPLIRDNMGIGFVPETMAQPWIEEKKLVRIRLDCEIPRREICLVFDRGREKRGISDLMQNWLLQRKG